MEYRYGSGDSVIISHPNNLTVYEYVITFAYSNKETTEAMSLRWMQESAPLLTIKRLYMKK